MKAACEQIELFFKKNKYEIHPMSFDNISSSDELKFLRSFSGRKMNDSFLILRHYPHYVAIHRIAPSSQGIFFIVVVLPQQSLSSEAISIYKKYFPNPILVINRDVDGNLVAGWMNSENKPKLLKEVLNQYFKNNFNHE